MTKLVNQEMLLQHIKDTATSVVFTNLAQTVLVTAQAQVPNIDEAITAIDFDAIVNGDVSGKKLPFKAKSGLVIVGNNGDNALNKIQHANFFAGSVHLASTELAVAKNVNEGDEFNVNAFDVIEIQDPT